DVIASAAMKRAGQDVRLGHRQPGSFAGQKRNGGRGIADERRPALHPTAHANLADTIEIDVVNVFHRRENLRTLPSDIGEDPGERCLAVPIADGAFGAHVLVAKNKEKKRGVLAHRETRDLSSW